jgi:hypothetical protein
MDDSRGRGTSAALHKEESVADLTPFENLQQPTTAIMAFMMQHGGDLPEFTRAKIMDLAAQPSPVDSIMGTLEALYAVRADLPDDGKALIARIAQLVTPLGWHGIMTDNRGPHMQLAMLRELGEEAPVGSSFGDPADDPAPNDSYVPPAPGEG